MEEKKVKTAPSKKATETAREVWPYVKQDYATGHKLKAEGKPIVWSCAMFPKEIYRAMDIYPYFPEHYGVLTGMFRYGGSKDENVEKEAVRFCRIAYNTNRAGPDPPSPCWSQSQIPCILHSPLTGSGREVAALVKIVSTKSSSFTPMPIFPLPPRRCAR